MDSENLETTEILDSEPAETGDIQPETPAKEKPRLNIKYTLLSLLVVLFTVGGLFLGLLGKIGGLEFFAHRLEGGDFLSGSLLGAAAKFLQDEQSFFADLGSTPALLIVSNFFELFLFALLAVAALTSVVCLILTLVNPKNAKRHAFVSTALSFLSYLFLFLWVFCTKGAAAISFTWDLFDLPLCVITALLFILLAVHAVGDNVSIGALNLIALLVTALLPVALCYPGIYAGVLLIGFDFTKINVIFVYLIALLIFVNLVLSAFFVRSDRHLALHVARNAIMFIAVAGHVILLAITKGETTDMMLTEGSNLLASALLALASLCVVVLSLTAYFVKRIGDGKAKAAAEAAAREVPVEEPAEEVPVEELPLEEYPLEPPVEEVPAEEAVEEPVPSAAEQSDFLQRMYAYANGQGAAIPAEEEPARPAYGRDSIYTYDPFINTLTPDEKNEFGDLFIARKSGTYGDLPVYVIGGDNSAFFRKVWIRYSVYDMTPSLKEKLYLYIRSISSK